MSSRIDFESMQWEKVDAGGMYGKVKKWLGNGRRIRVVEFTPRWNETEWCRVGHSAYVISGKLSLRFESGDKPLDVARGQAFSIPLGTKHKATCKKNTLVFMVDDLPPTIPTK